ncbi:hypothetical protein AMECASPLE_037885, partial [Ameca splendens]
MVGKKTAICMNGLYGAIEDNCVLAPVHGLLDKSKELNDSTLPVFLEELKNVTVNHTGIITQSPATISTIVTILNSVANASSLLSLPLSKQSTNNILEIAGLLTSENAKASWDILNQKENRPSLETKNNTNIKSSSSSLLNVFETISTLLANESFTIETPFILLTKTNFTYSF